MELGTKNYFMSFSLKNKDGSFDFGNSNCSISASENITFDILQDLESAILKAHQESKEVKILFFKRID